LIPWILSFCIINSFFAKQSLASVKPPLYREVSNKKG
jgi:hypothetical protein